MGVYWQRYGWVAPGEAVSGLEDEYRLAGDVPKLLYIKEPAPDREPGLVDLLHDIKADDGASYRRFETVEELEGLVVDDLSLLLSEQFEAAQRGGDSLPPSRAGGVPRPLTPTVGRDDELTAATARLRGGARLVTLTGPGGIGKSRLGLEVAHAVRNEYPGGVHYVPLAAVVEARTGDATARCDRRRGARVGRGATVRRSRARCARRVRPHRRQRRGDRRAVQAP